MGESCSRTVDVPDRLIGRKGFAIGGAEGVRVAGGKRTGATAADGVGELVLQGVAPGADDGDDAALKRVAVDLGRLAAIAPDDVVGPRQRTLRIGRIGGRHASAIDARKELADPAADLAVVAVLRNEHEDRDEAVELVGPREHPDPGPLRQVQDFEREAVERVVVDLEKLVARIILQDVEERAAA